MVPRILMSRLQTRFAKIFLPGAHLCGFLSGCTVSGQAIAVNNWGEQVCSGVKTLNPLETTGCQEAQS